MKRILLLLLLATSLGTIGQKLAPTKLVITNNINSPSAPFVNVQESNGEVNKIAKADLIDVLNFASAVNLPTTGVSGKIYVTNDDNKIYRWNGTIYQPLSGAASTVNTAFTQKTFAASMSVAHNPANPNFFVNITGNFSLSITGTQNGDSGIVNLYFSGTQVATLTATVTINKIITGASALVQVYFIHDSQGLKWYRDESGDGSSLNLAQVLSNGSTGNGPIYINDTEVDPTASTTIYGNSTVVTDFVTGQDTRQEPSKFVFFDGNSSFAYIKSRHDGGSKQKDFFLPNKPTGEYTLATLDDIGSGGAPNLQSVLNAGTYAENLAGNSSMELLGQNGGNGLSYISHSDDFGKGSSLSITPLKSELDSQINGNLKSTIKVDNGNVVISKETLNLTTNVSNTIGINIPTVNTTTNFPAKTVAGNYLFKTIPLNSYTVATLPAAVLNDEATVTDATSDAALTGGGTLTLPVWYNGTAWTKLGGGSSGFKPQVDQKNGASQALYLETNITNSRAYFGTVAKKLFSVDFSNVTNGIEGLTKFIVGATPISIGFFTSSHSISRRSAAQTKTTFATSGPATGFDFMTDNGRGDYNPDIVVAAIDQKGNLNLREYTVATLPTPTTSTAYTTVTDAVAPTYLGALTGGGTVKVPVFWNGTSWLSH
jgi:hypothetical protein